MIANVSVVDVATGRILPGQDVTIAGGRIGSIGPASRSAGRSQADRIDGTGKFLIPGLWGCI